MIFFALAFVLGAFCLQQMPVLPSVYWAMVLIPLLLINLQLAYVSQRFLISLKRPILVVSSFLFGFFWASTFAVIRLADELPVVWENKPIQIVGVIASVPGMIFTSKSWIFSDAACKKDCSRSLPKSRLQAKVSHGFDLSVYMVFFGY